MCKKWLGEWDVNLSDYERFRVFETTDRQCLMSKETKMTPLTQLFLDGI
jgi:hypothetical protein